MSDQTDFLVLAVSNGKYQKNMLKLDDNRVQARFPEPSVAMENSTDTDATKIADAVSVDRSNGYDLIRLIAASAVIFSHAYPLSGRIAPSFLDNSVGAIAVKVFFITSGFLVSRSWIADPSLPAFAI